MKNIALVLAGLSIMGGIVGSLLWRDLHAERLLHARLLQAQPVTAIESPPAVQEHAATIASPQLRTQTAPVAVSAACRMDVPLSEAEAIKVRMFSQLSALSDIAIPALGISPESDLLKDPDYRKARLVQQRIKIARSYPGLAEELGISDKDAEQLFDLMGAGSLALAEATPTLQSGALPAAVQTQTIQRQARLLRETGEQIRVQLGDARFAQFQTYGETRPARNEAAALGYRLADADVPLNDGQTRTLTTLMIAEQRREQEQAQAQRQSAEAGHPPAVSQTLAAYGSRRDESNRRTLEAMAPHLSEKQLEAMRTQYAEQSAARRRTVEFSAGRPPVQQAQ